MDKYDELKDSKFKLVNVAVKRCRELRSGATPKMYVPSKNTARIAVEEVKAGVIRFETLPPIIKKLINQSELDLAIS